jgi:hypothetical protein
MPVTHTGNSALKWIAIGITVIVSGLLTLLGIYGIGEYGIALFVLTPLFLGAGPAIIYGSKRPVTRMQAFVFSMIALGVFAAILLVFAIEGVICIVMASPIAALLAWAGSLLGYVIVRKAPGNNSATLSLILLAGIIPSTAFIEKDSEPELIAVTTSVEIDADAQTVWKNVVEFPMLPEPEEFIFKTGIAYPIDATIEGSGVGAVRHCNFSTGSFVEPITVWDEPRLLKFDVEECPAPMKELSFWDIDAPHLHDYFVSRQGQFKLTELPNGKVLLEGTTWYYNNIKPSFYWEVWSDHIIHSIHERVLGHIKNTSEKTGS